MSELPEEVVEANSLATFETPYAPVPIMPIRWSIEKYKVAQMIALEGKTKKEIAKELGIPLNAINTWMKNPEFQEYINDTVLESAKAMKGKRLQLLMKIYDARVEEAEKNGYSGATSKDTLDLMTEIRKETGEEMSKDSSYTHLLEKLVLNTAKQQLKVITVEDV